jgi:hypothetical protein
MLNIKDSQTITQDASPADILLAVSGKQTNIR